MRNEYMDDLGLQVLRFQNIKISENTAEVINSIQHKIDQLKSNPAE